MKVNIRLGLLITSWLLWESRVTSAKERASYPGRNEPYRPAESTISSNVDQEYAEYYDPWLNVGMDNDGNQLNEHHASNRVSHGNETDLAVERAKQLFSRPLEKSEYKVRDWRWLRCRTFTSTRFDIGGTWSGEDGNEWFQLLKDHCDVINFSHMYINREDWGDAMVRFDLPDLGIHICDQKDAVRLAVEAAKRSADGLARQLYIWDCPGFEDDPNWSTERREHVTTHFDDTRIPPKPDRLPIVPQLDDPGRKT